MDNGPDDDKFKRDSFNMRITFQVRFHTEFGQTLWLTGTHPVLGNDRAETAVAMQYLNSEFWQTTVELPQNALAGAGIIYRYILRQKDGAILEDGGRHRLPLAAEPAVEEVLAVDAWNDPGALLNVFLTEPFQQVLMRRAHVPEAPKSPGARATHIIKARAPLLGPGEALCLVGNTPALGEWNTQKALLLVQQAEEPFWRLELDLSAEQFPVFYKFGVCHMQASRFARFEDGPNRTLLEPARPGQLVVVDDGFAELAGVPWKGAGVAVPVFSLRTEHSFGIGEFTDLEPLVDWCKRTGLKVVQILPVNDTTATNSWRDSYPYSAISAFALHPLYLNLSQVADGKNGRLLVDVEPERQRLNALETVDYEPVLKAKMALLKQLYAAQKQKTFKSVEYRNFFAQNKSWLLPYAVFCFLRDRFGTADFTQWPEHKRFDPHEAASLLHPGWPESDAISFHFFTQFHLHKQLEKAARYAHANGVILKGDIPIGVYRYGVDAWQAPDQYQMSMQAGAPPDPFSDKGQNWSFPTYDWPRMREDGYAWWKQRFEQMGRYFDAFRIDHVLGFFRIWSVPVHAVEGILGYFVPALPVTIAEFAARGIPFDRDRFVKPYITDAVLTEVFGTGQAGVRERFLQSAAPGQYALRPEFSTQRQVENYFAELPDEDSNRRLKLGLFDLISNVLLLEPPEGNGLAFHFRFGIEKTSSFRQLDALTQTRLKELYIDYFFRRQEEFWRKEGLQKLPALKRATNMLVCGEDLGMVPACVPEVMKQLGLLSLEVQRMPKRLNQQFSSPKNAPYMSIVTPSTHDMSTIRGWWKEDPAVIQQFFNVELGEPGIAPEECEPWINQAIVRQHLASPAMWSIFQLQDLLGMDPQLRRANPDDERINVPANPTHYWRYRMHLTLEQLLAAESYNTALKQIISEHGR